MQSILRIQCNPTISEHTVSETRTHAPNMPAKRAGKTSVKSDRDFRDRLRILVHSGFENTAAFARACGIPQPRVTEWLAGEQMPGARYLQQICERTGVSADWLLLGRGGKSVVPWSASRSREALEQDLALHVHAHIRKRDREGAFNLLEGRGLQTDWLVDGCGLMASLLRDEEHRILEWAKWEHKVESLLRVSDDIEETLIAFVPSLPEADTTLGVLVHRLGDAAIRARLLIDTLGAPSSPNCIRRTNARTTIATLEGPQTALEHVLRRIKRSPGRPSPQKFKFSETGELVVAPLDALSK